MKCLPCCAYVCSTMGYRYAHTHTQTHMPTYALKTYIFFVCMPMLNFVVGHVSFKVQLSLNIKRFFLAHFDLGAGNCTILRNVCKQNEKGQKV